MAATNFANNANYVDYSGTTVNPIVSPAHKKMALSGNYLDIQNNGWAQQYLPELYEKEVERYGDRTISGFLKLMSAELPLQSDQVIWSEQGRLHLAYEGQVNPADGVIDNPKNIDTGLTGEKMMVRKGATVVCTVGADTFKALVVKGIEDSTADYAAGNKIQIKPYGGANVANIGSIGNTDNQVIKFFVYGSEFSKGTDGMKESIEPSFQTFINKPMILKDHFEINGSDTAQIGWVEVSGESGQGGYLWYLKSSGDTRVRFEEYLEMSMVEAETAASASTVGVEGSEGLFQALENRGIVVTGMFDDVTDPTLASFDSLIKELDKQGSIEENMLYLNRDTNLGIDDMIAGLNPHTSSGLNYGLFNNSEDMALNLGFDGFRRGGYDFYKTGWKYLNDASTRGLVGGILGCLIPAGSTSVYDQSVGSAVRRPFLHVRYRAGAADDRKLKSWVTGSVGGATSSSFDKMEVHYLSERCLITQGANNFMLFKS